MKALLTLLLSALSLYSMSQNTMVYQPNGGNNDGTDQGGINGGKDTWANRYSPSLNGGNHMTMAGSARSNCNTSDYKAYYQFDLSTLPEVVDSVFFGVRHTPHTAYCYSNCNADFYFFRITSAWNEMTLTQLTEPTEETTSFYGPIAISFPNDLQFQEYDITMAYRNWKDGTYSNFGFTVYSTTIGCNNAAVVFGTHSSDDTVQANRPYLKIYYPSQASIDEEEQAVDFYPNPFSDYIQIDVEQIDDYFLTDLTGRTIAVSYDKLTGRILTSHLDPGLYLLHLERDGHRAIRKLIKH